MFAPIDEESIKKAKDALSKFDNDTTTNFRSLKTLKNLMDGELSEPLGYNLIKKSPSFSQPVIDAALMMAVSDMTPTAGKAIAEIYNNLPGQQKNLLYDYLPELYPLLLSAKPGKWTLYAKAYTVFKYYFAKKPENEIDQVLFIVYPKILATLAKLDSYDKDGNLGEHAFAPIFASSPPSALLLYAFAHKWNLDYDPNHFTVRLPAVYATITAYEKICYHPILKCPADYKYTDALMAALNTTPQFALRNTYTTLASLLACYSKMYGRFDTNYEAARKTNFVGYGDEDTYFFTQVSVLAPVVAAEIMQRSSFSERYSDRNIAISNDARTKAVESTLDYTYCALDMISNHHIEQYIDDGICSLPDSIQTSATVVFFGALYTNAVAEYIKRNAMEQIREELQAEQKKQGNTIKAMKLALNPQLAELQNKYDQTAAELKKATDALAAQKLANDSITARMRAAVENANRAEAKYSALSEQMADNESTIKELEKVIADMDLSDNAPAEPKIDYHAELADLSKKYSIVLVGGNPNMLSKLQPLQLSITYLGAQVGKRLEDACANADIVFVKYDSMSHKMFFKVKNVCEKAGVPYLYVCPSTAIPAIEKDLVLKTDETLRLK